MELCLSDDQNLIAESVRSFFARESPVARMREIRDSREPIGFSRSLWLEMAKLGWPGIMAPEKFGGGGFGNAELGIIAEHRGRTLVPEPFFSTALLGVTALTLGGTSAQQSDILPKLVQGESILTLAWQERPRFHPTAISTRARDAGAHYVLDGEKRFVPDGHIADQLVVVARTSSAPESADGLSLFLVDSRTPGVSIVRTTLIDGTNSSTVRLEGARVGRDGILGHPDQGQTILDALLDRASAFLAAELVGISLEAFDRTLHYLKSREQFGSPIGSFQALQHRAARLFCECEMAVSVSRAALCALDANDPSASRIASAAKAKCSEVAVHVTNEAIQMHGGIGMTDDHEIGMFLKRARVVSAAFGDHYFHLDRFAALSGF